MSVLTLEKLNEAKKVLDQAGPKIGLYSSRWYPRDGSVTFTGKDGEIFHVAHPDVWRRVLKTIPRASTAWAFDALGIKVVDLDAHRSEAARVFGAMAETMMADYAKRPDLMGLGQ